MKNMVRFFSICILAISLANASLDSGKTWLTEHTTSLGMVTENTQIALPIQAISETVMTLQDLNESVDQVTPPLLSEQNTTGSLARMITYLRAKNMDTTEYIHALLLLQGPDGGFAPLRNHNSTVLDTAFAIKALMGASVESETIRKAVVFIQKKQQADGAWSDHFESDRIYVTMQALSALYRAREEHSVESNLVFGRDHLLEKRNGIGSWGETYLDALGISVLLPLVSKKSDIQSSFDHIEALQKANGSWENDIYTTALALKSYNDYVNKVYSPPSVQGTVIEGEIRDSDTGEILPDVHISMGGENNKTALTDAQGRYKLIDLASGETQVRFTLEGYQILEASLTLKERTKYILDRALTKVSQSGTHHVSIEGEIRDSDTGEVLPNVQIILSGQNSKIATTDAQGKYKMIDLVPGEARMRFILEGYQIQEGNLTFTENTRYIIDRALSKTSQVDARSISIEGVVRDIDTGETLPNVQVRLNGENNKAVVTDAQGKYKIAELIPGEVQVHFDLEGYRSIELGLDIKPRTTYILDQDLRKEMNISTHSISIEGRIRDHDTGEALSDVQIILSGRNTNVATTDAQGKYKIIGLVSGITQIYLSREGYEEIKLSMDLKDNISYIFDQSLKKVIPAGQRTTLIKGTVLSEQNLSIAGAIVHIREMNLTRTTEDNGSFVFHDIALSDPSFMVSVEAEAFDPRSILFTISNLNENVSVIDLGRIMLSQKSDTNDTNSTQDPESTVTGSVRDEQGDPLGEVKVSIAGSELFTRTDSNGTYHITKQYDGAAIAQNDYAFTLVFERDGFINAYQHFGVEKPEDLIYDTVLRQFMDADLRIDSIGLNKEHYHGYESVGIFVHIQSLGTLSQHVTLILQILHDGEVIDTIKIDHQNSSLQDFVVLPDMDNLKQAQWYTGIQGPGEYKVVATLVNSDHAILAKKEQPFTIDPFADIDKVHIRAQEHLYYKGVMSDINSSVEITNHSNITHTVQLRYYVRTLSGEELGSRTKEIEIDANVLIKKVPLDPISIQCNEEGIYQMIVEVIGGDMPEKVINDTLLVLPPFRITPAQSLTPYMVAPDSRKKIKIRINIRGEQ